MGATSPGLQDVSWEFQGCTRYPSTDYRGRGGNRCCNNPTVSHTSGVPSAVACTGLASRQWKLAKLTFGDPSPLGFQRVLWQLFHSALSVDAVT